VELLAAVMAGCYVLVLLIPPARDFFALAAPDPQLVAISAAGVAAAWMLTAAGLRLTRVSPTMPAWPRTR
jgi:hypothetical protein